jgi:hypothetical protein
MWISFVLSPSPHFLGATTPTIYGYLHSCQMSISIYVAHTIGSAVWIPSAVSMEVFFIHASPTIGNPWSRTKLSSPSANPSTLFAAAKHTERLAIRGISSLKAVKSDADNGDICQFSTPKWLRWLCYMRYPGHPGVSSIISIFQTSNGDMSKSLTNFTDSFCFRLRKVNIRKMIKSKVMMNPSYRTGELPQCKEILLGSSIALRSASTRVESKQWQLFCGDSGCPLRWYLQFLEIRSVSLEPNLVLHRNGCFIGIRVLQIPYIRQQS